MWLECTECGERFESDGRPRICETCGTAGAIFALEPHGDVEPDSLNAAWLAAGLWLDRFQTLGSDRSAGARVLD